VTVKDGYAALNGTAATLGQKELVERIAKGVSGIIGIENGITIRRKKKVPDAMLLSQIRKRISVDPELSDSDITVSVDDGIVTLAGDIPTIRTYERIHRKVSEITGVSKVISEKLKVRGFADKKNKKQLSVAKRDKQIRLTLEDVFRYSPRLIRSIFRTVSDKLRVFHLRGTSGELFRR
jgi:hypothetical protein